VGLPGFGDANCATTGNYASGICNTGSFVGGSANCTPGNYAFEVCDSGHSASLCNSGS